jgi:hypothetical protein
MASARRTKFSQHGADQATSDGEMGTGKAGEGKTRALLAALPPDVRVAGIRSFAANELLPQQSPTGSNSIVKNNGIEV